MVVNENKTPFDVENIIALTQRENNSKRRYIIVNKIQAKHVPSSPDVTLKLFNMLGEELYKHYKNEKVTFIGFAETATAIGAAVSAYFSKDAFFIHTTRENIDSSLNVVNFEEEHSHATEQKLFCNDAESMLKGAERIIFVEDEITTGKTILNFIEALEKKGINAKFTAASIVNGMNIEHIENYKNKNVDIKYLIKIENNFDNIEFSNKAEKDIDKVDYNENFNIFKIKGRKEPRTGLLASEYEKSCSILSKDILNIIDNKIKKCSEILVLGTEECMYPSLYTANEILNNYSDCKVFNHSTTRSPISPFGDSVLKNRASLKSVYSNDRQTYVYNISKHDIVLVITDSKTLNTEGLKDIYSALKYYGNENIYFFIWEE